MGVFLPLLSWAGNARIMQWDLAHVSAASDRCMRSVNGLAVLFQWPNSRAWHAHHGPGTIAQTILVISGGDAPSMS